MASLSTPGETVAHVAYISSDHIFSVQPSLSSDSEFSSTFRHLSQGRTKSVVSIHKPEIESVRQNADPLLHVLRIARAGKLVTVTTTSSILLQSVPYLYKLAQYPVVLHVSLKSSDYSDITAIRQSGFTLLHSESLQETQDLALTAHALAVRSGKGCIHFFDSSKLSSGQPVTPESVSLARSLLDAGLVRNRQLQPSPDDDSTLYADDGRSVTIPDHGSVPPTRGSPVSLNFPSSPSPQVGTPSTPGRSLSVSSREGAPSEAPSNATSMTSLHSAVEPKDISSEDIYNIVHYVWGQIAQFTKRQYYPFEYAGPRDAKVALFVFGADGNEIRRAMESANQTDSYTGAGLISVKLYRPWLGNILADGIPRSVSKIAVLEQIRRRTTRWGPILMDLLSSLRPLSGAAQPPSVVGYQLGHIEQSTVRQALNGIFSNLDSSSPVQNLEVGTPLDSPMSHDISLEQPQLENAYMKILNQVFGTRLFTANRLGAHNTGVSATIASNPEFGFGALISRQDSRQKFVERVQESAKFHNFTMNASRTILSKWLLESEKSDSCNNLAPEVISTLEADGSELAKSLLKTKSYFFRESQWLIGSDAWAFDLGNSGVHNVLASGQNVNMLIIDSTPYSERAAADAARRKKDIGLYAMNFGNAYVASTAVYSSYTQVLEAMIEADKFNGPSVVLAYLPYSKENDTPLNVLQETKKAVDVGYWPLYRWTPSAEDEGEPDFQLDSERIKHELEEFLKRDNQFTQLMKRQPDFAANLSGSFGSEVRDMQKRKAKDAYAKLLEGLQGAPMTILFASDNGNAESLAKRLANRGKARGLKTMSMAMDDYPLEDLSKEENVILITSTAGQGEFPQNGRSFWEAVKNSTDFDLTNIKFSVFALGDSHYWPRKEDKIYYNKPGKDLNARMISLGGTHLVDIGLGDDQDPDGYQTGYAEWEPKLWQALDVANVEGLPEEPPPITNEDIKIESNYLRGTIAEGLQDTSTGAISANDQQLTKFHGTYMQDDRDLRDERKAQGLEPAYSFMIRCRLPGGVATPSQWLQMDAISDAQGNETMKLTTRQTFQFHGIVKGKLRTAMQNINKALMTTLAACGDVNRNVMCSSLPERSEFHAETHAISKKISDHLLPSTAAYHEIWIQEPGAEKKTQIAGDALQEQEPMYGATYLPRKFKITIAIPPHNDTDVYAHDIGLIAIKGDDGHLQGFNVLAGGGMGVTHNMKKTYPRTGSMFGYVPADKTHIACEKIMLVQRDHGDRKNRKHARLKYTIDDMGVDVFKGKVEEIWGEKFEEPKPFHFDSNIDTFGWQKDEHGMSHFTVFIENGRIEDTADFPMKTGLKEIAKVHKGEFRLTGNQHLIISNVKDEDLPQIKDLMAKYKLDNTAFSGLRLSSSACVAFPTCGMAFAESERYLPQLITKMESTVEEAGIKHDSIVMRVTGCPNGCARPWLAEIGLVGKAYGVYNLYLGGGYHGQRLNKLYRSNVQEEDILEILKPMIKQYALERKDGERFGDFVIRAGLIKPTLEGKLFHEDTAEAEEEEE